MKNKFFKYALAFVLMGSSLVGCEEEQFNETEKYKVTYNANGGSGEAPIDATEYEKGAVVTVKENTFIAPENKEFVTWFEDADCTTSSHRVGSTFKIYENIDLYAQWLDVEVPPVIDDENAEHKIKVNAPTGITYTLSATKAYKNSKITLTVTCSNGVSLNGNPTSSQTLITKESDTTYSFIMPGKDVTITIKALMEGDVIISGDINAKLEDADGDGIYTADVDCPDVSYAFTYIVKDSEGNPTRLSSLDLDETRCDANVTFTTNKENELLICGGATYTFAYDSNATGYNCFVTRKSVSELPSNSKTLYNLFDGKMRSQSTIHPQGLTSIHYEKKVTGNDTTQGYKEKNEVYDYKKISATESFAVSKDSLTNTTGYVYKNIDAEKDVYSIVNTYTKSQGNNEDADNVWTLDPYGEMQGDRYFPYSAKQDIVTNDLYRDTGRYRITTREAYRNVNMAAHYGSALEYEIWQAVRGDYSGSAAINAANAAGSNCSIKSVENANGFVTTLVSQLEYNHVESGSTADVTQEFAHIYNATFNFNKKGDLVSLDFKEDYYSKDNWNFSAHKPLDGGVPITITIKVTNGFNETFNRNTVLGSFNPADYFISSINKLSFYDEKAGAKSSTTSVLNFDDKIQIYDYLGGAEPVKLVDEFEFSPATALDAWQYGFVKSSNENVAADTVYGPKTVGIGDATITIGNHLENYEGAKKDVKISVYANGTYHGLYVNATVKGYDSFGSDHADYIYGYAGKTMTYYIDSSVNTGCPVSYWMVIKAKDEYNETYYTDSSIYFNVVGASGTHHDTARNLDYVKVDGNVLTLDFNTDAAKALRTEVQIDVIFGSDYYADGFGPSTLHIVVGPAQKSIANSKFAATYTYAESTNKFEDALVEFKSNGTGVITETLYSEAGAVTGTNTFNFSYTENNNGTIDARITSVVTRDAELPTSGSEYTLVFKLQQNGILGVALYTDDHDIFGETYDDGEYVTLENLDGFTRVGD